MSLNIPGFLYRLERVKSFKIAPGSTFRDLFGALFPRMSPGLDELNRIVSAYLDLAENRAKRGILMSMADWSTFLTGFLELSNYPILKDKGTVSALEARLKAEGEYEIFRQRQDLNFVSDFDLVIAQLEDKRK